MHKTLTFLGITILLLFTQTTTSSAQTYNCTIRDQSKCSASEYPICYNSVGEAGVGAASRCDCADFGPNGVILCLFKTTPAGPISGQNCPVCPKDYAWSTTDNICIQTQRNIGGEQVVTAPPTYTDCSKSTNQCFPGNGCYKANAQGQFCNQYTACPSPFVCVVDQSNEGAVQQGTCELPSPGIECETKDGTGINTAIGCIPIENSNALIAFILRWAIGIGGGIAFLLMLYAGFVIMTSTGNPERLKGGQQLLTSAIAGLIMLIFSIFILRLIGVNILQIPGFGT